MITGTDAVNIVYSACRGIFDIPVYQGGNVGKGYPKQDCIVIHGKKQSDETYWAKCFIEVNFVVPDFDDGTADLIKLNGYERQARAMLASTGHSDGTTYRYKVVGSQIIKDAELRAHLANITVLFQAINVKQ